MLASRPALCTTSRPPTIAKRDPSDPIGVVSPDTMGRINDFLILENRNYVPIDFIVLDIYCNSSCPIILGRPFLCTIGVVIAMKEGNIKFQFPLRKGMDHFPRKRIRPPYESIMRASYGSRTKDDNT